MLTPAWKRLPSLHIIICFLFIAWTFPCSSNNQVIIIIIVWKWSNLMMSNVEKTHTVYYYRHIYMTNLNCIHSFLCVFHSRNIFLHEWLFLYKRLDLFESTRILLRGIEMFLLKGAFLFNPQSCTIKTSILPKMTGSKYS